MSYFRTMNATTIRALCLLMLAAFLPVSSVNAAMVGTDAVIEMQQNQFERNQILDRIQAEDAQQALASLGVNTAELEQRVANMTPAELAELNAQIDELPAGGVGIFGLIVFVLIIMVVLDLLGAVDFFPAIKTIQY